MISYDCTEFNCDSNTCYNCSMFGPDCTECDIENF